MSQEYASVELHPQEAALIDMLRTIYRWGDVTIEMRDGLPSRLLRTEAYDRLDQKGVIQAKIAFVKREMGPGDSVDNGSAS